MPNLTVQQVLNYAQARQAGFRTEPANRTPEQKRAIKCSLKHYYHINANIKVDLSGLDLSGQDLSDISMPGVILSGTNLNRTILRRANLRRALLVNTTLVRADARGADLSLAGLSGVDAREADFSGAALNSASVYGGTNIQGAILYNILTNDKTYWGSSTNTTDAVIVNTKMYNLSGFGQIDTPQAIRASSLEALCNLITHGAERKRTTAERMMAPLLFLALGPQQAELNDEQYDRYLKGALRLEQSIFSDPQKPKTAEELELRNILRDKQLMPLVQRVVGPFPRERVSQSAVRAALPSDERLDTPAAWRVERQLGRAQKRTRDVMAGRQLDALPPEANPLWATEVLRRVGEFVGEPAPKRARTAGPQQQR